jgi:hypothetical protein
MHAIKACEEVEVYLHSFVIAEQKLGDPMHVIKACAGVKVLTPSSLNLALYRRDTMHTMKAYTRVEVGIHSFFTSTLDRGAPMHAIKNGLKAYPHALLPSTLNGGKRSASRPGHCTFDRRVAGTKCVESGPV